MATPRCGVCRSEQRDAIEAAVVAGVSAREIQRQFGVCRNIVQRHTKRHLVRTLANTQAARGATREATRGETLLAQLERQRLRASHLYESAQRVLRRAERKHDPATALAAIRGATVALAEMRATLELFGRLAGTMPRPAGSSTTVNVAVAVAGTEAGGHLVAKLSSLIAGAREKRLPSGEAEGEVITVEQAQ